RIKVPVTSHRWQPHCKVPTSAMVLTVTHNHKPFVPTIAYSMFCYRVFSPMGQPHPESVTPKACPTQKDAASMYISLAYRRNRYLLVWQPLRSKTLQKPLLQSKPIFLAHANHVSYVPALYTYRSLYLPYLLYPQSHHPTKPDSSPT